MFRAPGRETRLASAASGGHGGRAPEAVVVLNYALAMTEQIREVAGREVTITSSDKLYFPKLDLTKGDVIDYFSEVSGPILNCFGDRPILLQRFPNGVGGKSFFQKRIPDSAPEWLETTTVETVNGTPSRALVMADEAHLLWAVNLGAFTMHPWPIRLPERHVDELRIDLDPVPGIGFEEVRAAAALVRDWFESIDITAYLKTCLLYTSDAADE